MVCQSIANPRFQLSRKQVRECANYDETSQLLARKIFLRPSVSSEQRTFQTNLSGSLEEESSTERENDTQRVLSMRDLQQNRRLQQIAADDGLTQLRRHRAEAEGPLFKVR